MKKSPPRPSKNFEKLFGLVIGAFAGFSVAYFRIRRMEKTLDVHVFCNGSILKRGKGKMPSNLVYERK